MKNLKKLSRKDLKELRGAMEIPQYPDMCQNDAECPNGLKCGVYEGYDTNGWWIAKRCI